MAIEEDRRHAATPGTIAEWMFRRMNRLGAVLLLLFAIPYLESPKNPIRYIVGLRVTHAAPPTRRTATHGNP